MKFDGSIDGPVWGGYIGEKLSGFALGYMNPFGKAGKGSPFVIFGDALAHVYQSGKR
ncbi:MAG: hypothetical protein LBO00_05395 [Zoogloeaceae bacterium]|jgi:hypothetical protein|nr:hypothetical protein [Zoogloeaceae bacterium]